MEFRLLGPVEAVRADGQPVHLGGHKPRRLLTMLMLHANQVVTVDRLTEALWDEQPPATARQTIQYLIHGLRKALGGATGGGKDLVETHTNGYLLRVAPGAFDLDRFEEALRRARQAQAGGDQPAAAEALAEALALWRGPALADLVGVAFAQPVIVRLEEQRLTAVEDLAEVRLSLGQDAELIGDLEALTRSQPSRERVHGLLMLALYRSGRQAEALAVYRRLKDRLLEESGLEPGAELRRLEARMLAQDPTLAAPAAAPSTTTRAPVRPEAAPRPPAGFQEPAPPQARSAGPPVDGTAPQPAGTVPAPVGERVRERVGERVGERVEERRMITVLVAGIGLPAAATGDPEDSVARGGRALAGFLEAISRYGGTVVTVFGGTMLAVFGVPRAREDDPERAVLAALAICQDPPDGTAVKVGVDTGEAIVAPRLGWGGTTGGEQLAVAGGVTGAVLDVAARLQALAPPGGVLVGQAAHRATRRRFVYHPAGEAWRPAGPRSRIGMAVDAEPGRRSPLMERGNELTLLAGLLGRCRQVREPQLVTVVGAPGIGKTRLVAELGRQAEADPELITWRQGRSLPYGQPEEGDRGAGGVVFRALVEIVRAHTGISDTDTARAAGAKLAAAVADVLPDPAEAELVTGQLRRLLRLDPAGEPTAEQRQPAFAAWARFLEAVAEERPLALVFEDLHWADEALLAFVDQLVAQAGPVPLLVVCTGRPELLSYRPGWGGGKPNAVAVSLGPLSPAGAEALLDALLAAEGVSLDGPTRAALLARAGGNPLFLEEYVRVLRGRGPGDLPIPETVQQVITARIDQLDDADRRLLHDLAVVWEPITVDPLTALTGLPLEALTAALTRLERHELLGRVRTTLPGGQPAWVFRHALIREVAYNQLLRADRAARHLDVAHWLEASGADHGIDRAELLAHHYEQALTLTGANERDPGLNRRARAAFRAAGDRAAGLGAPVTAARHYARALQLWPPDDPDHGELLFRLGEARIYGEHTGEDILERARDELGAAGRLHRALEADVLLALAARSRNDNAAAQAHLERALRRPTGPSPARAVALAARAMDLMIQDYHDQAIAVAREALGMGEALGFPDAADLALEAIGVARLKRGDPGGAVDVERRIAMLERQRNPAVHYCRFDLAWGWWWLGDLARCAEVTAHGRREAERVDAATVRWFDAVQAGLDYAAGKDDVVAAAADRLLGGELSDEDGYLAPWYRILRGRVRLARARSAGDLYAVLGDAGAALEAAAIGHDIRYRQAALALRGRALLAAGSRDRAAAVLDELLGEQHAEPERASATPDLAVLLVDLDRPCGILPHGLPPTRWHAAVRAFAARDFDTAAGLYEAIGSPVDARLARSRAAG